jgi:glycosyltransferase involved in cell wall biosynthesis
LRDRTLRSAQVNVVPGASMQRYLALRGIGNEKVRVIHNWADGELIRPIPPQDNRLRQEWGLEGRLVVGYSGNMGRVHEFETILGAAEALKIDAGIVFLFIGDGAHRKWLESEAQQRRLPNLRFLTYQPAERLGLSLSVPDIHLVTLRPEVEGFVVPSKFYGIAAAGRPTLFVGSTAGEIAQIVVDWQCGIAVQTGDVQGLAAAIKRLRSDSALCRKYGENARRVFEERFEKRIALAAWSEVL